jgi:hypothetical protein
MDISFTSDEDEVDDNMSVKAKINSSDLYYDTNKSGGGANKPLRTIEHNYPQKRQTAAHSVSDTSHIRNQSKRGRRRQYT